MTLWSRIRTFMAEADRPGGARVASEESRKIVVVGPCAAGLVLPAGRFPTAAAQGRLLADQAKGPPAEGVVMTHHEHPNVTVVREGFEAFERGDMGWMDQHLADDVVWHVGGNSRWAGSYRGKAEVLEYFGRQAQAMTGPPTTDIHDIVGNDDHVVVRLG